MRGRVYISSENPDQLHRSAFDLAALGDFKYRYVDDPGKRDNPDFVQAELARSSVTLVLIGPGAAENSRVTREIAWSLEKGNGLVGVRLDPAARTPEMLYEAGAEILDWRVPADVRYLRPAIVAAARSAALLRRAGQRGTGAGESCARPTARFPEGTDAAGASS